MWGQEEDTIGIRAYDKLSAIKAQWKEITHAGKFREYSLLNGAYRPLEEDVLESLWKSVYEYQDRVGNG